jgi:hypothetical protein
VARHYSITAPKFQPKAETVTEKLCLKCNIVKGASFFSLDKYKKSGLKSYCKDCCRDYSREYGRKYRQENRAELREKTLWYDRKSSYGITKEQYINMLVEQNNMCAICLHTPDDVIYDFHVDHCHTTGKIRGLLCRGCNHGLGNFKDNITSLRLAAQYLEERGSYGS